MIHSIACNDRDCPWYRRGPACRHPRAAHEDVPSAGLSESGHPLFCPVRNEPDVIVVGESERRCVDQIILASRQLTEWSKVINAAKKGKK